MKYRQTRTAFWEDGYILDLSHEEKLLFIYLFTNSKVNLCGIYELPDRTISYTLALPLPTVLKIKEKLQKDNKFLFYKGYVFIINYAQHNIFSSALSVVSSFATEFNSIPQEIKEYFFKISNYEIPIKNPEEVIVMDKVMVRVMVKKGSPTLGVEAREDVDPDSIPDFSK